MATNPQYPLDQVLAKYRSESVSERGKGDKFERLMQAYLKTDPVYADKLSDVWLWSEFPFRAHFGNVDLGIDIVCKTYTGEYWAVQCKFYDSETTIGNAAIKDGYIKESEYPFGVGKYEIKTAEGVKKALSADQISKLKKFNCTNETLNISSRE